MKRMTNKKPNEIKFVFFGTAPLSRGVLAELAAAGYSPARTIETTDITPELIGELRVTPWDVFIVASYGKKIPKELLEMPARGVVNVHPSLLPRLRGASPIRSAILQDEKETGVSIMLLDEELDHGPLIAQKKVAVSPWPPGGYALDELLAHEGGKLLATVLPEWLSGALEARAQNDDVATYCKAFKKEDGLLDLKDDAYKNLLKIRAYEGWPVAYTFFERAGKSASRRIRVQLLDAHLEGTKLVIDTVKPEGKGKMGYADFLRGGAKPL
jgi:methionyl-tRNA formyltransferase